jgi:hypothetical protein
LNHQTLSQPASRAEDEVRLVGVLELVGAQAIRRADVAFEVALDGVELIRGDVLAEARARLRRKPRRRARASAAAAASAGD